MAALLRGAIIPLIFKKTMLLPHVTASESAATTLMSTDVEGIVNGVPKIHEIWAAIVEIGLGLYLLTTVIDQAAFLVVVPVTGKCSAHAKQVQNADRFYSVSSGSFWSCKINGPGMGSLEQGD